MFIELLNEIFATCIVPLLAILVKYLIDYLKTLRVDTNNKIADKYLIMLKDTITTCVAATNQTYVEALKNKNAFDKEAQEYAYKTTYNAVMAILTEESTVYLNSAVGDLEEYIKQQIEGTIAESKVTK